MQIRWIFHVAAGALLLSSATPCPAEPQKAAREEGEYRVLVAGNEIGTEKYDLVITADSALSTSRLDFRNPAQGHQRVRFETRLEMGAGFVPRSYELKSDVDGRKGSIVASISPNQVIFEYTSSGTPRKVGVLTGKEYSVLDTNVFHHFIFLARRYNFESGNRTQELEVVIPQESDSGILKVTRLGSEDLLVKGKKTETRRLQVDSGSLLIQLWVDRAGLVQKIAVPGKNLEVLRR